MTTSLVRMRNLLEERITIPADGANLDGCLAYPEESRPTCAVLLIGAHPLLGGNMANNVVTALRAGLAVLGAVALSFEYRRPGEAGTEAWTGMLTEFWQTHHVSQEPLWRDDARSAADALRRIHSAPLVLVGYSFGCWALAEMAATHRPAALVCISPNPNDHDLAAISSVAAPLLVVSSDNDFSCTPARLQAWLDSLNRPRALHTLPGAEHFFRGREPEVIELVANFLRSHGLIEN